MDDGSEFSQSKLRGFEKIRKGVKKLHFVTWSEVAKTCQAIASKRKNLARDPLGAIIAQDFSNHLKENNMTTEPYPEIYLRDIVDVPSVELYFRHHIYKCQSRFYNSARKNLYFAPYFTQKTASEVSGVNLVPVGEGISFISRVESVHVVEKRDLLPFFKRSKASIGKRGRRYNPQECQGKRCARDVARQTAPSLYFPNYQAQTQQARWFWYWRYGLTLLHS